MKAEEIKLFRTERKILLSETNIGDLIKIYHFIISAEGYEDVIIIVKYILCKSLESKEIYENAGLKCVKQFKDAFLMKVEISFKISTFAKIYKEYFL